MILAFGASANAVVNTYDNTVASPFVAIPDNSAVGATLTINVPDGGVIADINVGLIIAHTWQGDLIATLTHGATTVTIINRPGVPELGTFGFSTDNFGNPTTNTLFVLDDEAAQGPYNPPVAAVNNPVGSWKADGGLLSAFDGADPSGLWTLKVTDHAAADTGTLRRLNLAIDIIPAPGTLALLGLAGLCGPRRRRA
jgi:subtilisin-like proprotein convertase family protein